MSNFKIGQRVKKVRGEKNVGLTGIVVSTELVPKGTVVEMYNGNKTTTDRPCSLQIKCDGSWFNDRGNRLPSEQVMFCAKPELWEPLVPIGMTPVEWDKCLWQPDKEEVTVNVNQDQQQAERSAAQVGSEVRALARVRS